MPKDRSWLKFIWSYTEYKPLMHQTDVSYQTMVSLIISANNGTLYAWQLILTFQTEDIQIHIAWQHKDYCKCIQAEWIHTYFFLLSLISVKTKMSSDLNYALWKMPIFIMSHRGKTTMTHRRLWQDLSLITKVWSKASWTIRTSSSWFYLEKQRFSNSLGKAGHFPKTKQTLYISVIWGKDKIITDYFNTNYLCHFCQTLPGISKLACCQECV